MLERIHCPLHSESTPSCVIYDTHAYCYGGCGRIELSVIGRVADIQRKERYKEDMSNSLEYIDGLPKKSIRGFDLPYDEFGYYIVWPNYEYYKRRNWEDSGSKYKNPTGHAQPMYRARELYQGRLFIVEGELNALSVALAFPNDSVVSPGSAGDFKTPRTKAFLTYCTAYCTIVLLVDRDGPGTEAAIYTKSALLPKVKDVKIVLMQTDANQVLCDSGKEALRQEVESKMS